MTYFAVVSFNFTQNFPFEEFVAFAAAFLFVTRGPDSAGSLGSDRTTLEVVAVGMGGVVVVGSGSSVVWWARLESETGVSDDPEAGVDGSPGVNEEPVSWIGGGIATCGLALSKVRTRGKRVEETLTVFFQLGEV